MVMVACTLKNKWTKRIWASTKTTVARKVDRAPWKTWGPVLTKISS